MLRSMTGFGQAARTVAGIALHIDLKSVNHRYCEVVVRLPRELASYEDLLRKAVMQRIKRGRLDLFLSVEREKEAEQAVGIDWRLADAYVEAAAKLKERYGLEDALTLRDLLELPGVAAVREAPEAPAEEIERALLDCVNDALDQLASMREKEGANLQNDLESRLASLESYRLAAAQLAGRAVREYGEKLKARVRELLQTDPDEARLAMEIALFADRANIDEELTRLHSHSIQFGELLRAREPVGRKLDFLVQEMNREVNTIGSKANLSELTALVVDMKAELEKMREQIQNIE